MKSAHIFSTSSLVFPGCSGVCVVDATNCSNRIVAQETIGGIQARANQGWHIGGSQTEGAGSSAHGVEQQCQEI